MVCLNLFNRNCSAQHRLRFVLNPMPEATLSGETASKHALQLLQPNLCALRQYAVQICYAMLCYVMLCCVAPSWAVLCCAALSCAVLCHAVLCCAKLCDVATCLILPCCASSRAPSCAPCVPTSLRITALHAVLIELLQPKHCKTLLTQS